MTNLEQAEVIRRARQEQIDLYEEQFEKAMKEARR